MNRRLLVLALGAITVVALLGGVFPIRTFLSQRADIEAEKARVAVLAQENERLAQRVEQLHTEAEVERLAREQYNMVRPGEEAYAILPAPEVTPADPEGSGDDPGADAGRASDAPPVTEPIASRRSEDASRSTWRKLVDALTLWD